MKIKWPSLRFPPINLLSMFRTKSDYVEEESFLTVFDKNHKDRVKQESKKNAKK